MYDQDERIVLTLDAGGSSFAFSAIQGGVEVIPSFSLPAFTNDLNKCLNSLFEGFARSIQTLKKNNKNNLSAISFAFPGPADYENGIIGDLPNFPAFRGGVPLGEILSARFCLPVFINNDGNLFAYGEALLGILPEINRELTQKKCGRVYKNILGITFGTGFGSGIVINNELLFGDNGCGGDIWLFRNKLYPNMIAEESVSVRGIVREYQKLSGSQKNLTPKDIFYIAEGKMNGNQVAAQKSFAFFGEVAGDAVAHMLTFLDGIVVLGGGIIGAAKYIIPSIKKEMKTQLNTFEGSSFKRLQMEVYDLTDKSEKINFLVDNTRQLSLSSFLNGDQRKNKKVQYRYKKQTGIAVSHLGTNKAIALGAYCFALRQIDLKSVPKSW